MANYVERKKRRQNGAPVQARPVPPWWLRDGEMARVVLHGPFHELRKAGEWRQARNMVRGRDGHNLT